jgi:hypothetical protein
MEWNGMCGELNGGRDPSCYKSCRYPKADILCASEELVNLSYEMRSKLTYS